MQTLLVQAEFEIEKENIRQAALASMDQALADKQPIQVYVIHRKLYGTYADLRQDPDCQQRRAAAREQEKAAFIFQRSRKEDAATAASEPVPPAQTQVRLQGQEGLKESGQVVAVPVTDTVYALDTGTGKVAWRQPIGYHPSFPPTAVTGEQGKTLLHRPRDQSLVLVESGSGKEIWHTSLAAARLPLQTQPLFADGNVYLIAREPETPELGRMLVFNLASGEFAGQYIAPQPLTAAPMFDPARNTILVAGEQASLYSLSLRNHTCEQVIALDHEVAGIRCAPVLASRFLFIIECRGPDRSRLRCFVLGEDGSISERQTQELHGCSWYSPVVVAGRLFLTTDQDHYSIYDLADERDRNPLKVMFRQTEAFEAPTDQPFPLTTSDREFWRIGREIHYQRVNAERGLIEDTWEMRLLGPPVVPPQAVSGVVVIASQHPATAVVKVLGLDAKSRRQLWQAELGELPAACRPDPGDPSSLLVVRGTQTQKIAGTEFATDRVVTRPPAERPIGIRDDPTLPLEPIPEWTEGVLNWGGVGQSRLEYFSVKGHRTRIRLAAAAAGKPALFGKGILVPGQDGLLYWLDPRTGAELGDPFVGPYDKSGQPVPLGPVTAVDDRAIVVVAGRQMLRLVTRQEGPITQFHQQVAVDLPEGEATQMASTAGHVLLAHAENLLLIEPEKLAVQQTWPLGAPVSRPPVRANKALLLLTDRNELVCVGGGAGTVEIRWQQKLQARPIGHPIVTDQTFWLAFADGRLTEYGMQDGVAGRQQWAGRTIYGGPWLLRDQLAVLAPDGSLVALSVTKDRQR